MTFRDSSLPPRMIKIRDRIWGKHLKTIADDTGLSVGLLELVHFNQRKRLTEDQYKKIEDYIEKRGW